MAKQVKRRDLYARLDQLGIDWLCAELDAGRSVRAISEGLGATATAVLKWLDREPGRMRQYQLTRQALADAIVDELITIADEPVPIGLDGRMDPAAVNEKRLRIDTRKWIATKFRPSVYGDKVEVTAPEVPPERQHPNEILGRLVALLARNGMRVVPDTDEMGQGDPQH